MKRQFYKQVRIYPNESQKALLGKNFGYARYIWNWCVGVFNENKAFNKDKPKEERRKNPSSIDNQKAFRNKIKNEELEWTKGCDSRVLLTTTEYFFKATRKFFTQKGAGAPKFKCKDKSKASYTTIPQSGLRVKGNRIHIPKVGYVRFRGNNITDGDVFKRATISSDGDIYHISVLVEEEILELEPNDRSVGIDLRNQDNHHNL